MHRHTHKKSHGKYDLRRLFADMILPFHSRLYSFFFIGICCCCCLFLFIWYYGAFVQTALFIYIVVVSYIVLFMRILLAYWLSIWGKKLVCLHWRVRTFLTNISAASWWMAHTNALKERKKREKKEKQTKKKKKLMWISTFNLSQ